MKLTLGFSPCPNDTYIFDALVNKKIDTGKIVFKPVLEDVETLNKWAKEGKLDITKLSFPAFFDNLNTYILINSGAALGNGVGPLLISKTNEPLTAMQVAEKSIAIPGINTTANLLLSLAYPSAKNKTEFRFSDIEDAVLSGKTDLGVLIHENRFTYQQRGLHLVEDLGAFWEQTIRLPVPLGGIAIRRDMDASVCSQLESLVRKSVQYALDHYPAIPPYVKQHSQTLSDEVMKQHIMLYVNDYSVNLGNKGHHAIEKLYEISKPGNTLISVHSSSRLFLS